MIVELRTKDGFVRKDLILPDPPPRTVEIEVLMDTFTMPWKNDDFPPDTPIETQTRTFYFIGMDWNYKHICPMAVYKER